MSDYYEILGINKDATDELIKKAFREKSKQYHPDTTTDESKKKELENKFKEVNTAYQTLSDPQERAAYDNPRPTGPSGFPPGFNPLGGMGGFNINLNDLFGGRMNGMGGGHHFLFTSQTQINQEINISLLDAIMQNEIEIQTPEIGRRIKFKIPADFKSGNTYTIKISDDKAKNQGAVILQLKMNLIIPNLSNEKKEKIKEILSSFND